MSNGYYDSSEISPDELAKLSALMGATPQAEDKQNQFAFINNVVITEDTTRVGNVTETELGMAKYPIRAYKSLALDAKDIMENEFFSNHFLAESETVTSTSLSKEGFLVKQSGTQTRHIADITKRRRPNKGWFARKEQPEPSYVETGGYAV